MVVSPKAQANEYGPVPPVAVAVNETDVPVIMSVKSGTTGWAATVMLALPAWLTMLASFAVAVTV